VKWYFDHLKQIATKNNTVDIIFLTDDIANRTKAKEEGLLAYSGILLFIIPSFIIDN
jgi:hypothetical protein